MDGVFSIEHPSIELPIPQEAIPELFALQMGWGKCLKRGTAEIVFADSDAEEKEAYMFLFTRGYSFKNGIKWAKKFFVVNGKIEAETEDDHPIFQLTTIEPLKKQFPKLRGV